MARPSIISYTKENIVYEYFLLFYIFVINHLINAELYIRR
jgi:hypothetical protein